MSYRPRHAKQSPLKRRATTLVAGLGVVASLAAPAPADAAPVQSSVAAPSVDAIAQQANAMLAELDKTARNTAWDIRNSLRQQANSLAAIHPDLPAQAKAIIDNTVETFFPGLIAEKTPKPKPAPRPAPAPAPNPRGNFDYGPCPADAKACVDIEGRRSWLQENGRMYYQAGLIGPGKPGHETPRGTFYVNRKVKDEISWEFGNAPMPYATYFTYNGIAFHQGDPNILSHGCIRMYRGDAQRYFNDLQIGDKVYVY